MGPKLSVSLRVDLDREDVTDRAMNEFRYAWMRNGHCTASRIFPRVDCLQLFLAETIQPHHFRAFARLGGFTGAVVLALVLAFRGGRCRDGEGGGRGNGGQVSRGRLSRGIGRLELQSELYRRIEE